MVGFLLAGVIGSLAISKEVCRRRIDKIAGRKLGRWE